MNPTTIEHPAYDDGAETAQNDRERGYSGPRNPESIAHFAAAFGHVMSQAGAPDSEGYIASLWTMGYLDGWKAGSRGY